MQEILSKIAIGSRIKELRLQAGLSQLEIAQKLEISRSNYSQIELGNQFPTFEVLCRISSIYSKSYEWLLHGSVHQSKKNVRSYTLKKEKAPANESEGHDPVFLIRSAAHKSYVSNCSNLEFLESQEVISIPFLMKKGVFRAFEVGGNNMRNTLYNGDILIARSIPAIQDARREQIYVVVTNGELIIGRLAFVNPTSGLIICLSDADPLDRRVVYRDGIKEIWEAEGKYSTVLCRIVEDINKSVAHFESSIINLEFEISRIREQLKLDSI